MKESTTQREKKRKQERESQRVSIAGKALALQADKPDLISSISYDL